MLLRRGQLSGGSREHKVRAMPAPDEERLLTLAELASYLHMGQKTVLRLAEAKKIPGRLIDREWRFRRGAIDTWLESQSEDEAQRFEEVPDGMMLPLSDLLPESAIVHDMQARDPLGAIEELAARAYAAKWLNDKPWFIGAVVEREVLASTAMEGGVAFLHTRAKDKGKIIRPFLVCGRSWEGIQFGAPDGRNTFLFFLMGLKYDKLHLPILGRLARALRNPQTIAKLRAMSSPDKLRALLLREDEQARNGVVQAPVVAADFAPKLDKTLRLRAIRRLGAIQKAEAEAAAAPPKPKRTRAPKKKV
jgi:excisionase family DNA binding protein